MQSMIEQWIPLLIAIISVSLMLLGNYRLQKKMLTIHNKEKAIDLLIATLNELKDLYIEYWNGATHNTACSLKIKIQQTWFLHLLIFTSKQYTGLNKKILESQVQSLIMQATGDKFEDTQRDKPNPDKCIKISKSINQITIKLMTNKI